MIFKIWRSIRLYFIELIEFPRTIGSGTPPDRDPLDWKQAPCIGPVEFPPRSAHEKPPRVTLKFYIILKQTKRNENSFT